MRRLVLLLSFLTLTLILARPLGPRADRPVVVAAQSAEVDLAALPIDQVIILFEDAAAAARWLPTAEPAAALTALGDAAGATLTYVRPMGLGAHVLRLERPLPPADAQRLAETLSLLDGVIVAEPDRRLFLVGDPTSPSAPDLTPNDPRWGEMWHLGYTAGSAEGVNLVPAWNITTGAVSTVVAVIDTGILPHSDLAGRTVAGYDFVSDPRIGNDGNGRDPNPADPGDWITSAESSQPGGFFQGCQVRNSSWHGTHVAGTIGAVANNSLGIAGINWQAKILPVRVLGKCGGVTSDIIDGMLWAAGLAVPGAPANANPAKVINLSLGGVGACSAVQQSAVNAIVAAGTALVVAAGNSNADAGGFNPANCNQVITVAATNRSGNRAYYSNYGSTVEISGPGGETNSVASNGVLSTLDTGTTSPAGSNTYAFYQGTSMAAPHVAGVASLIVGLRPSYTPTQLVNLLRSTARPFPAGSSCTTALCGSGIADAYRALSTFSVTYPYARYLPIVPKTHSTVAIGNPGFEAGETIWSWYSSNGWRIIVNSQLPPGVAPHGGSWLAWLGGGDNETSYVQQTIAVPNDAPHLAWWHWAASAENGCEYDVGTVRINGTTVRTIQLCQSQNTGGWVQQSVNLNAYRNQSVTLRVQVVTDGSINSNLFLDDFAFRATAVSAELPLSADTPEAVAPRAEP